MKFSSLPGAAHLRFDLGLKAFDDLVDFYLNAPERVKSTGKKTLAKGPLSPVDVVYAGGAAACDVITRTNLIQALSDGRINIGQRAIEANMSPELSPWILTMMGSELSGMGSMPIDLYATACGGYDDQVTKAFQILARTKSLPARFWEIPKYDPDNKRAALTYLEKELKQFFEWLELNTKVKTTEDNLKRSIHLGNLIRSDMNELNSYLAKPRVPLAALEYYLIQMIIGDYAQDPVGLHSLLQFLLQELDKRVNLEQPAPGVAPHPIRVYVIGDETLELGLFNAIEDHGGVLTGCDFRLPLYYDQVDEALPPLPALANWIWLMPNNLPTVKRVKAEAEAVEKQKPDAIILSSVVGSRHLPGKEKMVKDTLKETLKVPVLSIETSLPHENEERIDYQIRAYFETIS